MSTRSTSSSSLEIGWFIRTNEGKVGPISTEEFVLAICDGRVVPQTLVRLTSSSQWFKAEEIDGISFPSKFLQVVVANSSRSAPPTQQLTSQPQMKQLFLECLNNQKIYHCTPGLDCFGSLRRSLAQVFRPSFECVVSYVAETIKSFSGWLFSILHRASSSICVWVTLILLMILLSIPLWKSKVTESLVTQKQMYNRLSDAFGAAKRCRSDGLNPEAWEDLRHLYYTKINVLIPKLEREAISSDTASLSLLWIARDYLRLYLAEGGGPSSAQIEEKIEGHLRRIEAMFKKAQPKGDAAGYLITAVVSVDVIIAFGALVYLGRSRLSLLST